MQNTTQKNIRVVAGLFYEPASEKFKLGRVLVFERSVYEGVSIFEFPGGKVEMNLSESKPSEGKKQSANTDSQSLAENSNRQNTAGKETDQQALSRELKEELAIEAEVGNKIGEHKFNPPNQTNKNQNQPSKYKEIDLNLYEIKNTNQCLKNIKLIEHKSYCWLTLEQTPNFATAQFIEPKQKQIDPKKMKLSHGDAVLWSDIYRYYKSVSKIQ